MKNRLSFKNVLSILMLAAALTAVSSMPAATLTWTNTAGGDWQAAVNWSPNQVPSTNDTAIITNNATYTVGIGDLSSVTVSNLTLGGSSGMQTLDIAGNLTLNGTGTGTAQAMVENTAPPNAEAGNLYGTGTLTLAGPVTLWGGNGLGGNISLPVFQTGGGTIEGCIWSGGNWINTGNLIVYGPFGISGGSVLSNAPAGTLDLTDPYNYQTNGFTGGGSVINNGLVLAGLPYGNFFSTATWVNNGTVLVTNNCQLLLTANITNNGLAVIAGGALLVSSNGICEFNPSSSVTGGGTLENYSTPCFLNGTVTCGSFVQFGTAQVTGALDATNSNFSAFSSATTFTNASSFIGNMTILGTVNFGGTGSIMASTLNIGLGLVTGTQLVNAGTLNWSGGTISGRVQCNGGTISGYINSSPCYLLGGELINTGLLTVQNTMYSPNISLFVTGNGAIVSNTPSAHINFVGFAVGVQPSGACAFLNAGLLTFTNTGDPLSPGTLGTITLAGLANSGTVLIESNVSLTLENGTTNSGQITMTDNASVSLSGTANFLPGSSFSVDGGFIPANDIATLGGTFNVGGTVNFQSGTNTFTGTATFTNAVNIASGFVTFNGTTVISGLTTTSGGTTSFGGGGSATVNSLMISAGTVNVTNSCNVNIPNGTTLANGLLNLNGTGSVTSTSLALTDGSETGTQAFQLSGPLNWTGPVGNITGIISANGGSINVPASSAVWDGGQLYNTGILNWTPNSGPRTGQGTIISNTASGVINVALNGNSIDSYSYGPPTAFYNAGQINISGAGQFGSITDPFFNTGTVTINSGTLSFSGGGTNSGSLTAVAGADLDFSGGVFYNTSGSMISGAGSLSDSASSGTYTFAGPLNLSGPWNFNSYATVNLTGSTAVSGNSNNIIGGGIVNYNGTGKGGSWQPGAVTLMNYSSLGGTTPVVASGPLNWTGTGGNITGIISANGGSVNVPASSAVWNGGQLYNTGTMTWTPNSGPRTGASTIISNTASGTINVALNGNNLESYSYGGTTAFYNAGQINISGAGQAGYITDPFYNTGTLNVNSGTLEIIDGGTNFGAITVAAGATNNFSGSTFNSTASSQITGAGCLTVSGGTFNSAGTLSLAGGSSAVVLDVAGGTANFIGSGPVTPSQIFLGLNGLVTGSQPVVTTGPLTWTGGSISGILQANGGSVNVAADSSIGPVGQWINTGTLTWTPNGGPRTGGGAGSVISNAFGATINVALNGNNLDSYSYGGTTAFYNAGQINLSGAGQTGSITDPFYNTGTLNVNSGTLYITGGGTNFNTIAVAALATNNLSNGTFTAATGSQINGGGKLMLSGGTFNSSGALSLPGGGSAVALDITGGTANFTGSGNVTPSEVILATGTLEGSQTVAPSGPLLWSTGIIDGTVIANGGSVNVAANSALGPNAQLINTGTMQWTPNSGPRTGGGTGTVISNAFGGTINVALNGNNIDSYSYGGTTAFYNAGQLNISGAGQTGFITDPFYNTGSLNVNSGTLGINGGATLTGGTINFGIANLSSFGTLTFPGAVALTGKLGVSFNGYIPVVSNSFALISYTSESGTFTSYNLPGTVNWQKTYGPTQFSLYVNSLIIGTTNIFVLPVNPPFNSAGFNFAVTGPAGSNYVVQVSTNLLTGNWMMLTNFTSLTTNSPVTDPNATNYFPGRFYRAYIH